MTAIAEYLLSVTCAAVLCSMISGFFNKKDSVSVLVKTLCRIFVTLAVLHPVLDLQMPDINDFLVDQSADYSQAAQQGIYDASQAQCAVIQQQSEAYVYDKAAQLDCQIQVSITLSTEAPYQPVRAQLTGTVSPYAKSVLTEVLANDLGIPKEEQQWIC